MLFTINFNPLSRLPSFLQIHNGKIVYSQRIAHRHKIVIFHWIIYTRKSSGNWQPSRACTIALPPNRVQWRNKCVCVCQDARIKCNDGNNSNNNNNSQYQPGIISVKGDVRVKTRHLRANWRKASERPKIGTRISAWIDLFAQCVIKLRESKAALP